MSAILENLYSAINNRLDAKDNKRAFTFIEFIKEFGYDNSPSSFLNEYKTYLSLWNNKKGQASTLSDKEFIQASLIDTLKSIILTYSSYEEQDFIANIDWDNEMHRKAIIPFFAEKIKNLCDFYKAKREEAPIIVNKNKFKGSRKSIEQIIYDKIIDFYFENRNLSVQAAEIKKNLQNNLSISIEQYIDIYSDYFDIPRDKECNDKTRAKFISANINTPNYEDYLQVAKVITETLYSGEVYLEEIPLIAQIGLDFSQKCVGDVATLRDKLLNNATINLISINEQIALRRRLYEKYLGCDLYYIYCDDKNNIVFDLLTKAENPSGNLLNCGTSDMAVVEADNLKLLSKIGLFFKPDKMGILKVNADNFKWEIDKSKLEESTFYIFPDPNKYGDIGNNKSIFYPLIYEYKLDSYIKNLSSGYAKDEPLAYISSTTWNTYYSAQDRDYILNKNQDFNYSFTSLANNGIISNYQVDIYGNEYGLFKGYKETKTNKDGKEIITIYIPEKFSLPTISYIPGGNTIDRNQNNKTNILFNGGYYMDPRLKKEEKFPHNEYKRFTNDYIWTSLNIKANSFTTPDILVDAHLNFGSFKDTIKLKYVDHYKKTSSYDDILTTNTTFTSPLILDNFKSKLAKLTDCVIVSENKNYNDLRSESGKLFIKENGKSPVEFKPSYSETDIENENLDNSINDIKNYAIFQEVLVVETEKEIFFFKQNIDNGLKFYQISPSIKIDENEKYNILFNETENKLVISILSQIPVDENLYSGNYLIIHEFDIENKKLIKNVINTREDKEAKDINNFKYKCIHKKIDNFILTYNNNLDIYLLTYLLNNTGYPYIYQHQFKLFNKERFYKTLQSDVIFEKTIENNQRKHIFNSTLSTEITESTELKSFFIEDNG
ncbi:MAG: hypothetical protein IJ341_12625 [Bacteroidales bacterium]|nr:hypothetical protein [Bacteroidales bacterium]